MYGNFIPVVCKERPRPFILLCIYAIPDDGWSGQPKYAVVLNKKINYLKINI
jgi:hypothetical protein